MKKNYKLKRKNSNYHNAAVSTTTADAKADKRENFKFLLIMLAWGIVAGGIYVASVRFMFSAILPIYAISTLALFIIFFFLNGGIAPRKIATLEQEKPEEMSDEEFGEFIAGVKRSRNRAKYFLVFGFPLLLCLLIDYVILYWGGKF